MVDSHVIVSGSGLRAHFAQKAVLPKNEAARAETFVATLESQIAKGEKPSTKVIADGTNILKDLEAKRISFEFSFAQVIASDTGDIDSRVEAISSSLGNIEQTAKRLRDTLQKLG